MRFLRLSLLAGLVALGAACANEGADLGFGPEQTAAIAVAVYLDRDGSRTLTPLDTVFRNARVAVFVRHGSDTLRVGMTDATGIARFGSLPLGEYRVAVVPASIGDSIQVQHVDSSEVRLTLGVDTAGVLVRLGYREVSIRQARLLPVGQRVFIRGLVLSGVQNFRDTTSHVADSSGAIRLTRVILLGGLTGNSPGDSVAVLGLVSSRAGQPTLDLARVSQFATRPPPVALPVTTGTASTANNGVLDAALIRITGAIITDTATVAPDFRVMVSDGSGALEMLLDATIPFSRTSFAPGRSLNAQGVLVPTGAGAWRFKPRTLDDVTLN
jgi:hypothetical protein